jgi:GNAT superfamily N-acetyltransferase
VEYNPAFNQDIVAFQTHLWGQNTQLNQDYWRWKYEQNPYFRTPSVFVSVTQGHAVGMIGLVGSLWEYQLPAQQHLTPCGADLMVLPEHRGLKHAVWLWDQTLQQLSENGFKYILTLSGNETTTRLAPKVGWQSLGRVEKMEWKSTHKSLPDRLDKYLHRLPVIRNQPKDPFSKMDHQASSLPRNQITIDQRAYLLEMSELIRRLGYDGRMRHVRDETYFAWRFQNPLSKYRFIYWVGERLEGYLVLQTSIYASGQFTWANIIDWEASSPEIRKYLLWAAIKSGSIDKLSIWSITMNPEFMELLKEAGFYKSPTVNPENKPIHETQILIRFVGAGLEDKQLQDSLLSLGQWDLRGVYSEGF